MTRTMAPRWLAIAYGDVGLREIPGKEHAPKITQWLVELGAWWRDDETPWCGVAVAAWMRQAGITLPKHWYRAKAWADGTWGTLLDRPIIGCVVVFDRVGGGHVGLLHGIDAKGVLQVIGGNQGNAVSIAGFPGRVARYVWPPGEPIPSYSDLTIVAGAAASTSEA